MSGYGYTLPATAVCPGCSAIVTLPKEPLYPDSPPAICATCDSEVPDYRRESFAPPTGMTVVGPDQSVPTVLDEVPLEHRRFSRGGLFKSLGGILAERGAVAVESAKDRFTP